MGEKKEGIRVDKLPASAFVPLTREEVHEFEMQRLGQPQAVDGETVIRLFLEWDRLAVLRKFVDRLILCHDEHKEWLDFPEPMERAFSAVRERLKAMEGAGLAGRPLPSME